MMLGLNTAITGSGGIAALADYALEFNGTDEYLQIALPNNELLASAGVDDFYSSGSAIAGWSSAGTIDWAGTTLGKTYTNTITSSAGTIYKTITSIVIGQKYKLKLRYQSTTPFVVSSAGTQLLSAPATSEWNIVSVVFTANSQVIQFYPTGAWILDYASIKRDQGFDLNRDQEQILHSKNWDFERTLGTELASGTVTIGSKYVVTAGTVEGNAVGTEFLAITNATTLDASNKVKPISNLVTNGTFTSNADNWYAGNGGLLSWDAGGFAKLIGNSTVGSMQYIRQDNLLTIGKRYRVSFLVKSPTRTDLYNGITLSTSWQVCTLDFTTTLTQLRLYAPIVNMPVTDEMHFDNVHCYEIPEWTASGNHTGDVSILDKSGTTGQSLLVTASGAGDTSNCVTLPSANLESCVSGKKYTIQGEARLDPASLSYGANVLSNGTFETGVNTDNLTAEPNCTLSFNDTEAGKTGSYCLKQTNTVASYGWYKTLPLNKVYKISLRYKSPSAAIAIRANAVPHPTQPTLPISADWSSVTFYTYLTGDYIRFWLNGVTSAYYDDIVIQQADMVTLTTQLGTKSVTSSALSIVAGAFTKFVLNFEATASEQSQDLKLWLSGAGSVFVDKLSLIQRYDLAVQSKFKKTGTTNHALIQFGYASTKPRLQIYFGGTNLTFGVQDNDASSLSTEASTLSNPTSWHNLTFIGNSVSDSKMYVDGVENDTFSVLSTIGKILYESVLSIGTLEATAYLWNGQISHIQIIRFENISQSSFNSAITGLQYPTGGGAEEVLRLTFQSGANITECLKDYSPKGHTVSGVNVDITNRKRVTA